MPKGEHGQDREHPRGDPGGSAGASRSGRARLIAYLNVSHDLRFYSSAIAHAEHVYGFPFAQQSILTDLPRSLSSTTSARSGDRFTTPGMERHGPKRAWWDSWISLWCEAGWPARALFLSLSALFIARAVYEPGSGCDLAGFLRIGGQTLEHRLLDDTGTNTYPPPFSVAMAPVTALAQLVGPRAVRHFWGLLQLAALGYMTLAFARVLRLRCSLGAIALGWLCGWGHVVDDLNNQNVSLFLWALSAWAMVRASQGRNGIAAAGLAVGATLKVMPGFPLIALLSPGATRRGGTLLGFAAGLLGSTAVTLAALRPDLFEEAVRFWLTRIVPHAGVHFGSGNRGWSGLALR